MNIELRYYLRGTELSTDTGPDAGVAFLEGCLENILDK